MRSRLPERWAGSISPLATELAVGLAFAAIAVGVRYAIGPLLGEVAPYVFVFAAVALATVIGGWRAGLITLLAGQLLTVFAIIGPGGHFYIDNAQMRTSLVVSTLSQVILLGTIALYQREVDVGTAEREQRLALLDQALKEIDHRTRNNYQTVLAMVELQARRASDENVRDALREVADRVQAISQASRQLALRSEGLDAVRLDDHLCELVQQIERGLSRREIKVQCDIEDVTAGADAATAISIIVNELVTNAIKHAFNGEASGHVRVLGKAGSAFELVVSDDGRGMIATRRKDHNGLGTKIVESFARQLGAAHEVVSSEKGTTHRLLIPRLD